MALLLVISIRVCAELVLSYLLKSPKKGSAFFLSFLLTLDVFEQDNMQWAELRSVHMGVA